VEALEDDIRRRNAQREMTKAGPAKKKKRAGR
jgi:hypothetical protein